jgi:hypothetical protein
VPRREGERAPREGGRREVECRDPFSGPRGGTRRRASMAAAWAAAAKAGIWSAAPAQEAETRRRSPPRVDGPAQRIAAERPSSGGLLQAYRPCGHPVFGAAFP